MATDLTYNGIKIQNVVTESVDQRPEVDQNGNWIYTTVTLRVTGIIWSRESAVIVFSGYELGVSDASSLGSFVLDTINDLGKPQKNLLYEIDSTQVFKIENNIFETSDFNNGPIPKVRLLHILGAKSAKIEFTVTFHTMPCTNASNIIGLSYWQADEIDEAWYTRRITRGTLRLRNKECSPHEFRHLAVPPLHRGFSRQSISFQESPDGLTVVFTITDKEFYTAPPLPAIKWTAHHSVIFPMQGATMAEADVNISVEGPKCASKRDLLWRCYQVLENRLNLQDFFADRSAFLTYAKFTDDLTRNAVTAYAKVKLTEGIRGLLKISGDGLDAMTLFGMPLDIFDYEPQRFVEPVPPASTSGLFYQVLLPDPCTIEYETQAYLNPIPGYEHTTIKTAWGLWDCTKTPPFPTPQHPEIDNRSEYESKYAMYRIESKTKVVSGRTTLPMAAGGVPGDSLEVVLHEPYTIRDVQIQAERLHKYPELPNKAEFVDVNYSRNIPQIWQPTLLAPELSADGRRTLYGASLRARYRLIKSPGDADPIPMGKRPYVQSGAFGADYPYTFALPTELLKAVGSGNFEVIV